jgi:hypothetical protein
VSAYDTRLGRALRSRLEDAIADKSRAMVDRKCEDYADYCALRGRVLGLQEAQALLEEVEKSFSISDGEGAEAPRRRVGNYED